MWVTDHTHRKGPGARRASPFSRPSATPPRHRARDADSLWGGDSLLGGVYTMVTDAVTGGRVSQCRQCGAVFLPDGRAPAVLSAARRQKEERLYEQGTRATVSKGTGSSWQNDADTVKAASRSARMDAGMCGSISGAARTADAGAKRAYAATQAEARAAPEATRRPGGRWAAARRRARPPSPASWSSGSRRTATHGGRARAAAIGAPSTCILMPAFGTLRLEQLSPQLVQRWLTAAQERARRASPHHARACDPAIRADGGAAAAARRRSTPPRSSRCRSRRHARSRRSTWTRRRRF